MKSLLKKLLPALALTLMIAGTVGARVINHKSSEKKETTWLGIRENSEEVPLDHQPTSDDCDKLGSPVCYYILDGQNPPQPIFDGPYVGAGQ